MQDDEIEKLRICKKCLLEEGTEKDFFQTLQEYIDHVEEDRRTSQKVYENRLGICKECQFLFQRMCRKCGCYVELRAAVDKNSCPVKQW